SHFPRKLAEGVVFHALAAYAAPRLRAAGIATADRVYGMHQTGHVDERYLLALVATLPPGVSEVYCHPAEGVAPAMAPYQQGYDVVPKLLSGAELAAAQADVRRYFPTDDEYRAAPERYPKVGGWRELPFVGDALNDLATHPELASFAERVIGTQEILLTQAILWGKYAGVGDHEQQLHVDFRNNSLVYPRDEGPFAQT